STYFLTRIIFLRALAFVYGTAFLVALKQNKPLIGNKGITPAKTYLSYRRSSLENQKKMQGKKAGLADLLYNFPTLLWLIKDKDMDRALDTFAALGLFLSGAVFLLGAANLPIMLSLWALYFSIVTVGQTWYGFGWESQLLETGFLAAFAVPVLSLSPWAGPVPWLAVWGFRWLLFRIMIGAGLIKIRGDSCWRDLTAMHYHYETQPVPNPLSYWLHKLPGWYHKAETAMNHVVELACPWLLLVPWRCAAAAGGLLQIAFQAVLVSSGNLSFLNWLTAVPGVWALDDAALAGLGLFPGAALDKASAVALNLEMKATAGGAALAAGRAGRALLTLSVAGLIARRSAPVVRNLLSPGQRMNMCFDPLRLVNTYGAFGSVTREREELVVEGCAEYAGRDTRWEEYVFPAKPGPLGRRPAVVSPYHFRLDWMLWIAAQSSVRYNGWLYGLLEKLLTNDEGVTGLLAKGGNPFEGRDPPKYVRVMIYRYKYSPSLKEEKNVQHGRWWTREEVGTY
ncbi:unnamed protein product, partial [Heterosigma akashiwo]